MKNFLSLIIMQCIVVAMICATNVLGATVTVADTAVYSSSGSMRGVDTVYATARDTTKGSLISNDVLIVGSVLSTDSVYNIYRGFLSFTLPPIVPVIDSTKLFLYQQYTENPRYPADTTELIVAQGTFNGASLDTTWFTDFTGWNGDGSTAHTPDTLAPTWEFYESGANSWSNKKFTTHGDSAVLAALGDTLRIVLLSALDVQDSIPTDTSEAVLFGTSVYNRAYLVIYTDSASSNLMGVSVLSDTVRLARDSVYATLVGSTILIGDADSVTTRAFEYWKKGEAATDTVKQVWSSGAKYGSESFSLNTSALSYDTLYYYTAYAINATDTSYAKDTLSFSTTITSWPQTTFLTISTLTDSTISDTAVNANPIRDIWSDLGGRIWLGSAMGLYRQNSDSTLERYIYDDSTFKQNSRNNIFSGAGLSDSTIYTVSPLGLSKHSSLSFASDSFISYPLIPDSTLRTIRPDTGATQVWIGGLSELFVWDDTLTYYATTDSGLAGNIIYDVAIDSSSSVYVATLGGVTRLIGGYEVNLDTLTTLIGSSTYALAYNYIDTTLWIGGSNGLVEWDLDTTWTVYNDSLPSPFVLSLAFSSLDTTMWVATDSGLVGAHKGGLWRKYLPANTNDSLPDYSLFSVAVDTAGRVWVGHSSGVTRLTED